MYLDTSITSVTYNQNGSGQDLENGEIYTLYLSAGDDHNSESQNQIRFAFSSQELITIDGNKDNAVVDVNMKMAGVYLLGTTDCTVRNCRLYNCTGDGISAQMAPADANSDNENIIVNN